MADVALPKYELIRVGATDVHVGDILTDNTFELFMVVGKGRTWIHDHIWIRISFLNMWDEFRKSHKIILGYQEKMYKLVPIKESTKKTNSKVKSYGNRQNSIK